MANVFFADTILTLLLNLLARIVLTRQPVLLVCAPPCLQVAVVPSSLGVLP